MGLTTFPGVGSGRFLRILVAIAVAAAVLMIIPPAQGAPAPGLIQFASAGGSITEGDSGNTEYDVVVQLYGLDALDELETEVSVDVVATGGSATESDFTIPAGAVVFPAGSSNGTLVKTILIIGDTVVEGNATIELGFDNLQTNGGTTAIAGQTAHTVTITNDDQAFSVAFQAGSSAFDEGDTGSSNRSVTVVLTTAAPLLQARTVDVVLLGGGTATAEVDFSFATQTVSFPVGAMSGATRSVSVTVFGDTTVEPDETVILGLANFSANGSSGSPSTHTLTITNDDQAFSVAFQAGSSAFDEGDTGSSNRSVTVVLTTAAPLLQARTVDVVLLGGGTATAEVDFSFATQTVSFPVGAMSGATRSVSVTVFGDTTVEPDETVILGLANFSANGSSGSPSTHTLTIENDDVAIASVNSPTAEVEGNPITFTVTMSNPSVSTMTVNYATVDGSAIAGEDYVARSGTLTFPPGGPLTQTLVVNTIDDDVLEFPETFTLVLSSPLGAELGTEFVGTGTILDNDGEPGLVAIDAEAPEEDGVIVFKVFLAPAAGVPVTVAYATQDGTAVAGVDYVSAAGTLLFTPGDTERTVEVTIFDNDIDEVDRTFSLVLSDPDPEATVLTIPVAIGTIIDDDNVAPTIGVMKTVDGAGLDEFVFAPGQTVRLTGTFTDPGLKDVHTATINWGDASPATVLPLTPVGTRTFQATHSYGAAGLYTISMTVRDEDGGVSAVKQAFVVIEGAAVSSGHTVGLVNTMEGRWFLYDDNGNELTNYYFGNPGDIPFMGDWNGNGIETPGLYRQSDGFVYLRNTNTVGPADIRFFFGDPGDVPIAGDFNGDGRDTLSIYRPSNQTFYIINELGKDEGGLGAAELSYVFGDPGDKPFVGDFNGNGVETVGLHRESTGFVYFRNSHTQGNADALFFFGDPGDRLIAGDWNDNGVFSPALFRPSNTTMYFRFSNTQGNADRQFVPDPVSSGWVPVSGRTN